MKKKLLILLSGCLLMATGCGLNKDRTGNNRQTEEVSIEERGGSEDTEGIDQIPDKDVVDGKTDEKSEGDTSTTNAGAVAEEMAKIEKESLAFENANWDIPQQEMNQKAYEWYELWDEELNSLWGRLMDNLSGARKDQMRLNQREWIDRKEKNVIAAGIPAYGGSLQPLLEYSVAKDMTRKQAYHLAACLAEITGEGYMVPDEVEKSYMDVDMNLSDVFAEFGGKHYLAESVELYVERLEESEYAPVDFPEGTSWLTWYSHGDILTDQDIHAYTKDVLVFLKNGTYYVLEKGYVGNEIIMTTGTDLAYMDQVQ